MSQTQLRSAVAVHAVWTTAPAPHLRHSVQSWVPFVGLNFPPTFAALGAAQVLQRVPSLDSESKPALHVHTVSAAVTQAVAVTAEPASHLAHFSQVNLPVRCLVVGFQPSFFTLNVAPSSQAVQLLDVHCSYPESQMLHGVHGCGRVIPGPGQFFGSSHLQVRSCAGSHFSTSVAMLGSQKVHASQLPAPALFLNLPELQVVHALPSLERESAPALQRHVRSAVAVHGLASSAIAPHTRHAWHAAPPGSDLNEPPAFVPVGAAHGEQLASPDAGFCRFS